jgi:hypothetical protein
MHSLLPSSKAEKVISARIAAVQTTAALHRNSLSEAAEITPLLSSTLKQML